MQQKITLLGATGSIGRSTLAVAALHPDKYRIHALAGGSRVAPLVEAAVQFRPKHVAVADESRYRELRDALDAAGLKDTEAHAGQAAVTELARDPECDAVLQAIVGAAGVAPTFAAARAGKRLMLANKESVVCGGGLLMRTVAECGATLLPVDSEHSAVFQSLAAATPAQRREARIILTASGGPFRGWKDLSGITPEMAVKHPKWNMGRKISCDSASLMNKGLEVIEAAWLFDFPESRIDVLVHPESIIHSMVEYADGAVMAELGSPDMKTPIAIAMAWPERITTGVKPLRLAECGKLTFEEADTETFPLLALARETLREGGAASLVMNAANEVAVETFLDHRISFTGLFAAVAEMTRGFTAPAPASLEEILALDAEARERTRALLASRAF
ncbi:1-deoxy-D-xylulose-5-phosphate reductoisomerase [Sutterella sp.]|uniref:1-deoxy-D-xylulose-5-phosphate reductoisomerase n=1 Tax=Sutterella sp. TaxID=1981025 RepID=UPI0026DFF417|nr:1-deoxy-D-xylulose-5-phosphate reductoisomerase [Sutterella sp.]MDO5530873.1 1-deoxy-D-xylulose-5-phosphate reductoisomerase [Sutterella sp.]